MVATRLITLTGPGGVGKTRLALALALETAAAYPDGVWFVDLAPLTHADLLANTIAATLGIRERSGVPVADLVCDAIDGKAMLLVLDNAEHVLDECASLAEQLLRETSDVQVLVTSREALRCGGEVRWPVPSLSVPESEADCSAETLTTFGATRLFVERAQALAPKSGDRRRTGQVDRAHLPRAGRIAPGDRARRSAGQHVQCRADRCTHGAGRPFAQPWRTHRPSPTPDAQGDH